jgi:hypothetical protein
MSSTPDYMMLKWLIAAAATQKPLIKQTLEECFGVIAPHGGDVAEVRSHSFAKHDKGEVSGKDVFAKSVAIEARHVSQGMHDLMRKAVQ